MTSTTNGLDEDMDYKTTCQECGLLRSDCECIDDSEEDYIHEGSFYPVCDTKEKNGMSLDELWEYQLTENDFEIGVDGITIKLNSNIIKKILHDQALANELRRTHRFYNETKNGMCAGVTYQILSLSNYGGNVSK